jgi:two-component system, cell cycle response regulator
VNSISDARTSSAPIVLIADDDATTREYIAKLLRNQGIEVEVVDSGQKAINRINRGRVDLVMLDIIMPGLDGLDTCKLIKGIVQDEFLPIILLTGKADVESRVIGLRIGADDYICKPFDKRELLARVNNLLRIKRMHDQVNESKARLRTLSVKDDLTELFNYRYLESRMNEEFKRAERYHEPLACVMVDIDFFKQVNDQFGHDAGDTVLREFAQRLLKAVREIDVVVRYGGEIFLLVLPSTNFPGALAVADRVWRAIRNRPFIINNMNKAITASLGVAVFPSSDIKTKDDLIKAADHALFQAKAEGRDGICVFQHQGYIYKPESSKNPPPQ